MKSLEFVALLKERISDRKVGAPEAWIRDWLIPNPLNEGRSIPHNAPVTLIVGLQMLFEFPYQTITCALNELSQDCQLAPYVCVRDAGPTEILIVDMTTSKIVSFDKHEAWKFRFKNLKALDGWMRERTIDLAKMMGRTVIWEKLQIPRKP